MDEKQPARCRNRLVDDLKWFDKITVVVSEFFGTATLVYLSCLGCVPGMFGGAVSVVQSSFLTGLSVMVTIFLFGHISGAHVNPLTTICALITGVIPFTLVPFYVAGEMIGGLAGYKLLQFVTPEKFLTLSTTSLENGTSRVAPGVCVVMPSPEITAIQALVVEFLLSLVLTFANCASWDYRCAKNNDAVPLKFGFLITTLCLAGGTYTGASMNPAKSFACAFWNQQWTNHWVYWVGALLAAVVGSIFYRIVFFRRPPTLRIEP